MIILLVGAELFHADKRTDVCTGRQTGGQTDRHDELIVTFHNFADAPSS